jgi:phage terminase large subunit
VVQANYRTTRGSPTCSSGSKWSTTGPGSEKYAHIWLGEYERNSEARVFKNWKVEEFERPAGTIFRLGADWGFSIDPSLSWSGAVSTASGSYVDHEAYMIGCEIVNLPELFMAFPSPRSGPAPRTPQGPRRSATCRSMASRRCAARSRGQERGGGRVAFLQSFDIIVHPRCQHVIDELTHVPLQDGPAHGRSCRSWKTSNNHCIDALRYACEGARRASKAAKRRIARSAAHPNAWMG